MARFSILVALPGVKGEEIDCDNDSYESPQNDNIDNDDEKVICYWFACQRSPAHRAASHGGMRSG